MLQLNEMSERAWDVTTDAIQVNPANYTAWHYRRLLINALHKDLRSELEFLEEVGGDNPKNYQIWHHRRVMSELIGPSVVPVELEATATIIQESDSKNYHAWAHRQWVVRTFNAWDGELAFVDELLEADVRNNSAWNHRWFTVVNTETLSSPEVRKREMYFALKHAHTAPHNSSPWSYIRGLLRLTTVDDTYADLFDGCEAMSKLENPSPGAISTLMELHLKRNLPEDKAIAGLLCTRLASEVDVIRAKYWEHRRDSIASSA